MWITFEHKHDVIFYNAGLTGRKNNHYIFQSYIKIINS